MAKKVMGEDGKMYKVKKPFYKRIWFWVLVVIIVLVIGGSLGGESNDKKASDNGGKKWKALLNLPNRKRLLVFTTWEIPLKLGMLLIL